MYEHYTRQSLPSKEYRELLGSGLCVFNSNNSFIIQNVLSNDSEHKYTWYDLIDLTSGRLKGPIEATITKKSDAKIAELFSELVEMRNRIMHSFQATVDGEQILVTKDKYDKQFHITDDYLFEFIRKNDGLSSMLHDLRGY